MTARDAGSSGTSTPQGPSFIRRHPILAGFGVLAALSLFAAYWPVSAIVTSALVGVRATGLDRLALRWLRTGAAAVEHRLRRRPPTAGGPPAVDAPEPPAPSAPPLPSPRPAAPAPVKRAPQVARRRAAPAAGEREIGGL